MTPEQLDVSYSALCEALTRVGEDQAALFLGALSLSLLARSPDPDQALALIQQAEAACGR